MGHDNYFIREGYEIRRPAPVSSEATGKETYWTAERIYMSRYYQRDVYKFARHTIVETGSRKVVDLGCGVATKLMELIHPVCADVTGVDRQESIDYCTRTYRDGTFMVDDLNSPRVDHGPYDLVISSDVIEHLDDPDQLLYAIKRLSRENALVILSTPDRDALRGGDCMKSLKPEHVREWNRAEFAAYLKDRGFDILAHRNLVSVSFSFRAAIRSVRSAVKRACGSLKTTQMVLCRQR